MKLTLLDDSDERSWPETSEALEMWGLRPRSEVMGRVRIGKRVGVFPSLTPTTNTYLLE